MIVNVESKYADKDWTTLTLKPYSGQMGKIVSIYFFKNTSLDLRGTKLGYFS